MIGKRFLEKARWLFTHPGFRRHPIAVLAGVAKWEWVRFRGQPAYLTLGPFSILARPHDGIGRLVCYFGVGADDILFFMKRHVGAGMTVVDVGANIGTHSLYAARQAGPSGRVVAFEPDPATADVLRKNLGRNGEQAVEIRDCCLGESEGMVRLNVNVDSAKSSLVRGGASTIDVRMETLDGAFSGASIDLLKIDVEGADFDVLAGGRSLFEHSPPSFVVIEVTDRTAEIKEFLRRYGYQLLAYEADSDRFREFADSDLNCYALHASVRLERVASQWRIAP